MSDENAMQVISARGVVYHLRREMHAQTLCGKFVRRSWERNVQEDWDEGPQCAACKFALAAVRTTEAKPK